MREYDHRGSSMPGGVAQTLKLSILLLMITTQVELHEQQVLWLEHRLPGRQSELVSQKRDCKTTAKSSGQGPRPHTGSPSTYHGQGHAFQGGLGPRARRPALPLLASLGLWRPQCKAAQRTWKQAKERCQQ